ncbi:TIGR03089 family protein [Kineosporia sp. R_H_3]|uniref:TIGR03089 family protein n=1 Tax=Kineosporia sp. R_H_3 TaxID=1961848 RepID=UPI000B4BE49C|nr:TIGR03089 family protein [Kineosporia sp. R_H_3]
MDDVPALLRRMVTTDPGRPRVTWYGPDGERVELSGKVLDNWVAKTANLLVDELDVGPGSRVVLDLPPHWRTLVWLLAVWSAGACVVVERPGAQGTDGPAPPAAEPVEVLVTADPDGPVATLWRPRADRLVVVALPALARSFGAGLPEDALDYALEVRTFGDVFVPFVRPARSDTAYFEILDGAQGISAPYAEMLRFASHEAKLDDGVRLLTGGPGTDPLLDLVGPLVADGSVVVHHDPAALDEAALERLAGQEGVTTVRVR